MGWIYLAESEDSLKPWDHGCPQLPIVKTIPTASRFFCVLCASAVFPSHQCGTISNRSRLKKCGGLVPVESISFTEDSPVRILVLQALGEALAESRVLYFSKPSVLLMKSDLGSSFSKTQATHLKLTWRKFRTRSIRLASFCATAISPPQTSEQTTNAKDGLDWPTPTASTYGSNRGGAMGRTGKVRLSISSRAGGPVNPEFLEWLMGFPLGWTELELWAMQWFRSKRGKHSRS